MEKGSKLRFPKAFHENRSVWLTGNSLFEVHKHEGSTFKVHIQQAFIEVKGTTFRIEQDKVEQNHITLFSGKVEFNVESTREKIEMQPFQKLTYNSQKASVRVQKIPNIDWKNGRFYFTDIPLDHFIEIVNQMNDTCIKLGTGVNTHTVFTGSIKYNESVEEIAEKICYSLNLKKREKRDNAIIIHN